jgi:hypothetical protein
MPEDEEFTATYEFFKGISTNDRSYLCDFHKLSYIDGRLGYRVILQAAGQKGMTVDMGKPNGAWKVTTSDSEVSPELEWKLISAILTR